MRTAFIFLWIVSTLTKCLVATRLPLFVDEAFYWQEGQHLAWAYSDLPGLTAWLIRLGVEIWGDNPFGVRFAFLSMAAAMPWMMVSMARREFGSHAGWLAGAAFMLLPLLSIMGLLALPDVPMTFATLLCIDAASRLIRRVDRFAAFELAIGLAIGALSHYRFVAVIGVGVMALLLLPAGRKALRDPRVWIAIAAGAVAWVPLLAWNIDNAEVGLRFQLVDRHPWSFHPGGLWFIPVQAAMVTPLFLFALAQAAWRGRRDVFSEGVVPERVISGRAPVPQPNAQVALFALLGGLVLAGFFVLGFVADTERVSFHWPLPAYLALLPLLAGVLDGWPRWLRRIAWGFAGGGALLALGYFVAVSVPSLRAESADMKWYPSNFAGWDLLAEEVIELHADMPADTRIVADNFKIGAELGFALGDPRLLVLDHPLNRAHGRAPQLELWGLVADAGSGLRDRPLLLVVGASDVPYRELLQRYHALCAIFGPLPSPRVLNVDHGRQRFLLFRFDDGAGHSDQICVAPAMAWVDVPEAGAVVQHGFDVRGWAFKDGEGVEHVEVTLDGAAVAQARYGVAMPGVASYWQISVDPAHPDVGFQARVELPAHLSPGRYWLGLRIHGIDGGVEDWSEQPIRLR